MEKEIQWRDGKHEGNKDRKGKVVVAFVSLYELRRFLSDYLSDGTKSTVIRIYLSAAFFLPKPSVARRQYNCIRTAA